MHVAVLASCQGASLMLMKNEIRCNIFERRCSEKALVLMENLNNEPISVYIVSFSVQQINVA